MRATVEREHTLRAPDGWTLHVVEVCPPEPRATVIAGHAMMVDRRTLWRSRRTPSLVGVTYGSIVGGSMQPPMSVPVQMPAPQASLVHAFPSLQVAAWAMWLQRFRG